MKNALSLRAAIEESHYLEVDAARVLLQPAIDQARASWISSLAIGDALLEELALLDPTGLTGQDIAQHLRKIADRLDQERAS